jgi:ribonuclease P protein component
MDIQRVARQGSRVRGSNLEFSFLASALGYARVAIVVPRHGRPTVQRNRVRRVLREHIRLQHLGSFPDVDLVVRALPGAYATTPEALRREVTDLSRRMLERTRK